MTIKEFIKTAIEGGYSKEIFIDIQRRYRIIEDLHGLPSRYYYEVFLDPEAWKAVGKVKEWSGGDECGSCEYPNWQDDPKYHMSEMIKALCSGKTLEEYIATLL